MRLGFVLYPETDLNSALQRWCRCGLHVLWWPDDETVVLGDPEAPRAEVMLEDHPAEHQLGPGPVFIVEAVEHFRAQHAGLDWVREPCEVPAGRYAAYAEPAGSVVRILDLTNDLGPRGALFSSRR
ncbi:MAG TPA: hypothetical protein VK053_14500 [Jiangellaceae bacterium]|nr:hypothetical protein [Jiangellaceae bacterium]